MCDRVAILLSGKVVRQGTLDELTAGSKHFEIQLHGEANSDMRKAMRASLPCELAICATIGSAAPAGPSTDLPKETGTLPTGESIELEGGTLRIATGDPLRIQPIIDALRSRGLDYSHGSRAAAVAGGLFYTNGIRAGRNRRVRRRQSPRRTRTRRPAMTQTWAIFLEAYRNLNSKKLFWLVLILSALVVAAFACMGINENGLKIAFWQIDNDVFNTKQMPPDQFYKTMFVQIGIGIMAVVAGHDFGHNFHGRNLSRPVDQRLDRFIRVQAHQPPAAFHHRVRGRAVVRGTASDDLQHGVFSGHRPARRGLGAGIISGRADYGLLFQLSLFDKRLAGSRHAIHRGGPASDALVLVFRVGCRDRGKYLADVQNHAGARRGFRRGPSRVERQQAKCA